MPSWADAFSKATPEPSTTITPIHVGASTSYATTALNAELDRVRTAPEGTRNHQLNRSTFALAQLVAAEMLDYHDVKEALVAAAAACGLSRVEAERTIGSGFRAGMQQPRQVELTEQRPNVIEVSPLTLAQPPADADTRDATQSADDAQERPRTSWWAQPVSVLAEGLDAAPRPSILVRSDGHGILYPGMTNGLIGESESGKSWLSLYGVHQEAASGGRVLILDFEDTARTTKERLTALGCQPEAMARILYASPDQSLDALASADLAQILADFNPTLIVLDGLNAAMTLLGLDLNSNTDATVFFAKLLRPLTATGAAVVTVDHVPKNPEQRGKGGIGAQAKRAMISGCTIRVEVSEPFGRGQSGKLKLYIDKDRPGHVRGHSGGGKYAGTFVIESSGNDITAEIRAPEIGISIWRPTRLMEAISRLLEDGGPTSKNGIELAIKGDRARIREALRHLIQDGHVTTSTGPRGATLCELIRPFSGSVTEVDPQ